MRYIDEFTKAISFPLGGIGTGSIGLGGDGSFMPKSNAKREQAMVLIYRLVNSD